MITKELIKKNFSAAAPHYDLYSSVQNLCAERLVNSISRDSFSHILDLGCGTGNYTRLLRERFPVARIKALDICAEMIDVARAKLKSQEIDFVIGDAESFHSYDEFDFITANASFQWFFDLENLLKKYQRRLAHNGIITFSIFGPLTLNELAASLNKLLGKDFVLSAANFLEKDHVRKVMSSVFNHVEVKEEIFTEEYSSLYELLGKIKYTGTRGQGVNGNSTLTAKSIKKLEEFYLEKHGKITATYQVFFVRGEK